MSLRTFANESKTVPSRAERPHVKVYRVIADVNHHQSLALKDERIWDGDLLTFDCRQKRAAWKAPEVYVLRPTLRRGSFFHLCPGALVIDAVAAAQLEEFLEMSGELLALPHEGDVLKVLNVTECVNALDEQRTTWVRGATSGAKIRIERYAFFPERLMEVPLFKIPETAKSEILTVEGMKDPEDEFKFNVESLGLAGLAFEELWDSDAA